MHLVQMTHMLIYSAPLLAVQLIIERLAYSEFLLSLLLFCLQEIIEHSLSNADTKISLLLGIIDNTLVLSNDAVSVLPGLLRRLERTLVSISGEVELVRDVL